MIEFVILSNIFILTTIILAAVILLSKGWAWNMFKHTLFRHKGYGAFLIVRRDGRFKFTFRRVPKDLKMKFGDNKANEVNLFKPSHYDEKGLPWFIVVEGKPVNVQLHKEFKPDETANMLGMLAQRLYFLGKEEGKAFAEKQEKLLWYVFGAAFAAAALAGIGVAIAYNNGEVLRAFVEQATALYNQYSVMLGSTGTLSPA